MMRRMVLMALCLCLLCGAAMAESVPGVTLNAMLQRSLDMLGSDFMQAMNTSSSIAGAVEAVSERVEAIAAGDYTQPAHVFLLTNPAGADPAAEHGRQMWPFSAAKLLNDDASSWVSYTVNGALRTESILLLLERAADDRLFACDRPEGCGILLLLYENGQPYALPWYAENGAVRVSGRFVQNDALAACDSVKAVEDFLDQIGMKKGSIQVTEIAWDAVAGSEKLEIGVGSGSFDAERAQELVQRMARSVPSWLQEQDASDMQRYEAAPRLIVVGDPAQNLLTFAIGINNMVEPQAVQVYAERFYERQAVEMLASYNFDAIQADDDLLTRLNAHYLDTVIYADETAQGSGAAILLYDDARPVCIYWYAENGAVHMEGWFGREALGGCQSATDVTLELLKAQRGLVSIQFREWPE